MSEFQEHGQLFEEQCIYIVTWKKDGIGSLYLEIVSDFGVYEKLCIN